MFSDVFSVLYGYNGSRLYLAIFLKQSLLIDIVTACFMLQVCNQFGDRKSLLFLPI